MLHRVGVDTSRAGGERGADDFKNPVCAASLCYGRCGGQTAAIPLAAQDDQACGIRSSGPKRRRLKSNQTQGARDASCKRTRRRP